ncbi:hypothetical protein [Streptomyces sp. NPDC004726]
MFELQTIAQQLWESLPVLVTALRTAAAALSLGRTAVTALRRRPPAEEGRRDH